jgi:hypothetical protein
MNNLDELIRELTTASGDSLHRVIGELGDLGAEARKAIHPLCDLVRYHEDRVARGYARLAIGRIDPSWLDCACALDNIGDVVQSARKGARKVSEETARFMVTIFVDSPIGTLDADANADPLGSRALWIDQFARQFPSVIPYLVNALRRKNALGEWLVTALGWIGRDDPEVVRLLEPLFDHESDSIRNAAFVAAAGTGRMPVEVLPRLIRAVHEDDGRSDELEYTLSEIAERHPRDVVAALINTLGAEGLKLAGWAINLHCRARKEVFVQELILLLNSPDLEIRREAAHCILSFWPAAIQAVPHLRGLLADADPVVREAARMAITEIQRRGAPAA